MNYFIKNATLVNEGQTFVASVLVSEGLISRIVPQGVPFDAEGAAVIDATDQLLIPGLIDEHVHFREPGMTRKANLHTESRAAVAGGVTSFMDMPNTNPQTVTQELLQQKFDLAAEKSLANFSFYLGATNDNLREVVKTDPSMVCGIKLFMGSSTGNMLVDQDSVLEALFKESPCLIAAHCEDEEIIRKNTAYYKDLVEQGKAAPVAALHPKVRTEEACYRSTAKAVELAEKAGARLHVLHVSTERELPLFSKGVPLEEKRITAETCPHYLWFDERHYQDKGFLIKCNPAIKAVSDREALLRALGDGTIDTIGSDHAPHLLEEKQTDSYFTSKSGMPSVQNTLDVMLELVRRGVLSLPRLVELLCHHPARLFRIDRRGFLREGYHADLVLVDLRSEKQISDAAMCYHCGWTPYRGLVVRSQVTHTFVNGNLVYENGCFHEETRGNRLRFV